jgi:hypothetical protein
MNGCTVDEKYRIRYGNRIHVLRINGLTMYFDCVFLERNSDLIVFSRDKKQIGEIEGVRR